MSNFSGAFDLSKLTNQNAAQGNGNSVAGWLIPADEQVLRRYLQLSESVPVLMLIVDGSEASNAVSGLVEQVIAAAKGRFAGIQVDLRTSPQLAQAIGVTKPQPWQLSWLAPQRHCSRVLSIKSNLFRSLGRYYRWLLKVT